eukprot:gnl/TRDRNA2_/TRDRNA2_152799_c2_seq1.p1 gnl/TRDRNA2_/TRDRNA2_152799_c2~~gnl/TRDRNA2_/TRDRNA2_152799_c2_seq1.p1  ORF type:complete len:304 (+),score=36.33 gnl/TRDRNA2_/TRDRNA2_152799_c2_seq1:118-912(+)
MKGAANSLDVQTILYAMKTNERRHARFSKEVSNKLELFGAALAGLSASQSQQLTQEDISRLCHHYHASASPKDKSRSTLPTVAEAACDAQTLEDSEAAAVVTRPGAQQPSQDFAKSCLSCEHRDWEQLQHTLQRTVEFSLSRELQRMQHLHDQIEALFKQSQAAAMPHISRTRPCDLEMATDPHPESLPAKTASRPLHATFHVLTRNTSTKELISPSLVAPKLEQAAQASNIDEHLINSVSGKSFKSSYSVTSGIMSENLIPLV